MQTTTSAAMVALPGARELATLADELGAAALTVAYPGAAGRALGRARLAHALLTGSPTPLAVSPPTLSARVAA